MTNTRTAPKPQWFTTSQAATICQVHPDTVKKWIKDGELDVIRVGRSVRITQAAIDDLAYRRRQRALENRRRPGRKSVA